jgi:hypothetical protein
MRHPSAGRLNPKARLHCRCGNDGTCAESCTCICSPDEHPHPEEDYGIFEADRQSRYANSAVNVLMDEGKILLTK